MDAFILKMKNLVNNLIAVGDDISEADLITYILGGLESDYEPIVNVLGIKPKTFTIEEVQNHLIVYETKLAQLYSFMNFDLGNVASTNFVAEESSLILVCLNLVHNLVT